MAGAKPNQGVCANINWGVCEYQLGGVDLPLSINYFEISEFWCASVGTVHGLARTSRVGFYISAHVTSCVPRLSMKLKQPTDSIQHHHRNCIKYYNTL